MDKTIIDKTIMNKNIVNKSTVNKNIIRTVALVLVLGLVLTVLTACNKDNGSVEVTLESMKVVLVNAGYEVEDMASLPDDAVGGFFFGYTGAHGSLMTPVLEFIDNNAAEEFAEIVNEDGNNLAIVNDVFLTAAHAHGGVAHSDEQKFLENLLSGKPLR